MYKQFSYKQFEFELSINIPNSKKRDVSKYKLIAREASGNYHKEHDFKIIKSNANAAKEFEEAVSAAQVECMEWVDKKSNDWEENILLNLGFVNSHS